MNSLKIIAGPCSIDLQNQYEIDDILSINDKYSNAIYGVRIVGLKSRTCLSKTANEMGIDYEVYQEVIHSYVNGKLEQKNNFEIPSIEIAKKILSKYNTFIASEIVAPAIQLPFYASLKDKFIPWNPAVSQIGWQQRITGEFAKKYNWSIGIKNGKNLGISIKDSEYNNIPAPIEKTLEGLASYADLDKDKIFIIQRGIDDPEKGDYRSYPIHLCVKRIKEKTGYKMFFDPSHALGPKLRGDILPKTIEAMNIKMPDNSFLYDGLLIEVGTSKTDTAQHISISELSELIRELSKFRKFN